MSACKCTTLSQQLVGDSCDVCNAAESERLKRENEMDELRERIENVLDKAYRQGMHGDIIGRDKLTQEILASLPSVEGEGMAKHLVNELFELGDFPHPCYRVEFRGLPKGSKKGRGNEKPQGGMARDPLIKMFADLIEKFDSLPTTKQEGEG